MGLNPHIILESFVVAIGWDNRREIGCLEITVDGRGGYKITSKSGKWSSESRSTI